jgi:hypothetical protein
LERKVETGHPCIDLGAAIDGWTKKLVDAWKPLYQTLDVDQKKRMHFLAMRVLHELKDAFDNAHGYLRGGWVHG